MPAVDCGPLEDGLAVPHRPMVKLQRQTSTSAAWLQVSCATAGGVFSPFRAGGSMKRSCSPKFDQTQSASTCVCRKDVARGTGRRLVRISAANHMLHSRLLQQWPGSQTP